MTANQRDNAHNDGELPNRRSIRLRNYDYSQAGAYFVTIRVEGRRHLYGEVGNGCMVRSLAGEVVASCWHEIPRHYREVELDEFVVMPNHVHGILVIRSRLDEEIAGKNVPCRGEAGLARKGVTRVVSTGVAVRSSTLGTIVGSYKSAVTRAVNAARGKTGNAVWQRGYYEHVVRDENELNRIREYVSSNPLAWHLDKENPDRIGDDPFDLWLESLTKRVPAGPGGADRTRA
jgi:putative transposase